MAESGEDCCVKDDLGINEYLRLEENELTRILQTSEKTSNPLEIIGYPTESWTMLEIDEAVVRNFHREKCLLLHPDKCKLKGAKEGFELLKNATNELLDPKKRSNLLELVKEARDTILRGKSISLKEDKKVLQLSPEILNSIVLEVRRSLTQERKRVVLRMKNEFERKITEAANKELERKRKLEYEEKWEKNRESRVHNWRKFIKSSGSKSKRKPADHFDVFTKRS